MFVGFSQLPVCHQLFHWWERLPEAVSGSRLQPGFSIRVSTEEPRQFGDPQFAWGTSQDMTRSPAEDGGGSGDGGRFVERGVAVGPKPNP